MKEAQGNSFSAESSTKAIHLDYQLYLIRSAWHDKYTPFTPKILEYPSPFLTKINSTQHRLKKFNRLLILCDI